MTLRAKLCIVISTGAMFLTSCGIGGPDDAPFLDGLGFSKPVEINHPLNNMAPNSIDAAMSKAGILGEIPEIQTPPFWQFQVNGPDGPNYQNTGLISIGRRKIDSKSEQRSWTENSSDYFSETVNYHIELMSGFSQAGITQIGPFSVRITAFNSPQIGHWVVQSMGQDNNGGFTSEDENNAINKALELAGQPHVGEMQSRIESAIQTADNQIKTQRMAAVGLSPTNNPEIYISQRNHKSYLRRTIILPNMSTFAQAKQICESVVAGGLKWRMANSQEIDDILDNGQADTPRGAIWGGIFSGGSEIVTDNGFNIGAGRKIDNPPGNSFEWPEHFYYIVQGVVGQQYTGDYRGGNSNDDHDDQVIAISSEKIMCVS